MERRASKMKVFWRWVRWTIINGCFAMLAWSAIQGSRGSANILFAVTWLFALMAFMALAVVLSETVHGGEFSYCESITKDFGVIPLSVDRAYDLLIGGLLIWHGWWFTGVGYTLSMFFQHFALEIAHEAVKQRKETA
jgi:hypothetical protein